MYLIRIHSGINYAATCTAHQERKCRHSSYSLLWVRKINTLESLPRHTSSTEKLWVILGYFRLNVEGKCLLENSVMSLGTHFLHSYILHISWYTLKRVFFSRREKTSSELFSEKVHSTVVDQFQSQNEFRMHTLTTLIGWLPHRYFPALKDFFKQFIHMVLEDDSTNERIQLLRHTWIRF